MQSAQQVLLPYLAQQLALYASQVNGQLQVQHPVQIVLLVDTVQEILINVQASVQPPCTELAQLTNAPAHVYLADLVQEILINVQASVQPEGMELDLRNNVSAHALMVHTPCLVMQLVKHVPLAHMAHLLGSVLLQSVQVEFCALQESMHCLHQPQIASILQLYAPVVLLVNMLQLALTLAQTAPLDALVQALTINALVLADMARTLYLVLQHALLVQLENSARQSD